MMVRPPGSSVALVTVSVLWAGLALRAFSQEPRRPDFSVQIWGERSAEFTARVRSYAELRSELERGLPPLRVTEDAAAILRRTRALARKVRDARAQAKPGDIFTSDARAEFRKALLKMDAATCAAVFDDNPGSLDIPINGRYPTHSPLSTMAPNVLASLPSLPQDLEYRFAGRQLLLVDTRAGIVIDRMASATVCRKSGA